jgi:hypothetical protein
MVLYPKHKVKHWARIGRGGKTFLLLGIVLPKAGRAKPDEEGINEGGFD